MKTLKENLKTVATYASADTTNAENFPAWTPSDAALLEQLAMTGTLGNSFYANAKEAAKEAVALLERADAQALAAAIVRGRNEGFIRAFPILGLVYLSKKNAHLFQDTFKKVVLTGNDLVDFIEVAKTVRGRTGSRPTRTPTTRRSTASRLRTPSVSPASRARIRSTPTSSTPTRT